MLLKKNKLINIILTNIIIFISILIILETLFFSLRYFNDRPNLGWVIVKQDLNMHSSNCLKMSTHPILGYHHDHEGKCKIKNAEAIGEYVYYRNKINDQNIISSQDLRLKVSQMNPGSEVTVYLFREGELLEIPVILGDVEGNYADNGKETILEGVTLKFLDEEMRSRLSVPEKISGVLVADIDAKSPYAQIMRPNTIIMEVNGELV